MASPKQDQPNVQSLDSPRRRIMVIYGTRPEAVKVAPLIRALDESAFFTPLVAVTAQHRSMLDQVNDVFGIQPDFDLDIHQSGQTLTDITTRALCGVQAVLHDEQPDAVVVQGDTTTVFAAALAAFYEQVPVVHLRRGLRTGDPYSPTRRRSTGGSRRGSPRCTWHPPAPASATCSARAWTRLRWS